MNANLASDRICTEVQGEECPIKCKDESNVESIFFFIFLFFGLYFGICFSTQNIYHGEKI